MKDKVDKVEGLGDAIAVITEIFGIDKVADKVAKSMGKEDCGCKRRREKLNKLVPFKKNKDAGEGVNE